MMDTACLILGAIAILLMLAVVDVYLLGFFITQFGEMFGKMFEKKKNLPPKPGRSSRHCADCGKELKLSLHKKGYDTETGKPIYSWYYRCKGFFCFGNPDNRS